MQSADYQTDVTENGNLIYTTEQWLSSLQGREMQCDRVAKPKSDPADKSLRRNDFLKDS